MAEDDDSISFLGCLGVLLGLAAVCAVGGSIYELYRWFTTGTTDHLDFAIITIVIAFCTLYYFMPAPENGGESESNRIREEAERNYKEAQRKYQEAKQVAIAKMRPYGDMEVTTSLRGSALDITLSFSRDDWNIIERAGLSQISLLPQNEDIHFQVMIGQVSYYPYLEHFLVYPTIAAVCSTRQEAEKAEAHLLDNLRELRMKIERYRDKADEEPLEPPTQKRTEI